MNFSQEERGFEALLDYLKHKQGFDLRGYKRATLERRFRHRMMLVNVLSYQDYLSYLQSHCEEWKALLDTVFINVTSFFRDRDTWDYLADEIVAKILASKKPDESIRVWSAGCAAGQEIYSLWILFAQALGIESCLERVQFFATDIDEMALQQSRFATYNATEVRDIPRDLLEQYFEKIQNGYVFVRQLRRNIVFGLHNLTQNAPMSKIDLLMCRNVLMYFNSETQAAILVRFHFSLKDNGFLFLGKTETLSTHRPIFMPLNLKHKVYTKGLNLELSDRLLITPKSSYKQAMDLTTNSTLIWQIAYETSPLAQLAVNFEGRLILANEQANLLFGLTPHDCNRFIEELEPGKLIASSASMKFYHARRQVTLKRVKWISTEGISYFDVAISPIFSPKKLLLGVNLTFIDVSDRQKLNAEKECDTLN
jgi:two-component system, chemotaxis family, CheB/CheR fusion protein